MWYTIGVFPANHTSLMENNMNNKHTKTTTKTIPASDQPPAPSNNWGLLSGEDWVHLLKAQPQFEEKCDEEGQRRRTLFLAASFFEDGDEDEEFYDDEEEDEEGEELDNEEEGDDIQAHSLDRKPVEEPDTACYEWESMRGCDIVAVLSVHPEIADVSSLRPGGSGMPLSRCPDSVVWTRLQDGDWARLLAAQPRFADLCPKPFGELRLAPDDWAAVLAKRPEMAPEFEKATLAHKVSFELCARGRRDKAGTWLRPGGFSVSCGPLPQNLPPPSGDDGARPDLGPASEMLPNLEADIHLRLLDDWGDEIQVIRHLTGKKSAAVLRNEGALFEPGSAVACPLLWKEVRLASVTWASELVQRRESIRLFLPIVGEFDESKLVLPYVTYRTDEGKERRVLLPHRMTYDGLPMHLSPKPFGTDGTGEPPRYWTVGADGTRPYDGPYRNEEN